MRVVFALGGRPETQFAHFGEKIRSLLVSFHYKQLLKYVDQCFDCDYLLLDSGAFSAWSAGASIDVTEYADWLDFVKEKYGARIKRIEAINLDVITNSADSKETLAAALNKSMQNLKYLHSRGHAVLPVHHQFECYSILEDYAKDFSFVCISPNNREHTNSKRRYLDNCFARTKASIKTHGLAVTAEGLATRYPWFSVDSSIVQTPFRYGRIGISHSKVAPSEGSNRNFAYLQRLAFETIRHMNELEKKGTDIWMKRGVTWTV